MSEMHLEVDYIMIVLSFSKSIYTLLELIINPKNPTSCTWNWYLLDFRYSSKS
jgi:hypothetical protein